MACVLDPDIAVLFFFTRQQKLICRLFAQPKQKNGTDQNRCQFPKKTPARLLSLPAFPKRFPSFHLILSLPCSFLTKDKETTLPDRLFIFCIPQNAASHLLTPSQGQVGNRNRRFCLPLRNEGLTSTRQYRNPV